MDSYFKVPIKVVKGIKGGVWPGHFTIDEASPNGKTQREKGFERTGAYGKFQIITLIRLQLHLL